MIPCDFFFFLFKIRSGCFVERVTTSLAVIQEKDVGTLDRVIGGKESRLIYMMRRQAQQLLLMFGCGSEKK